MNTPEMNERMTTLNGASADAASVERVKVVSATPRQQNVNVPSSDVDDESAHAPGAELDVVGEARDETEREDE